MRARVVVTALVGLCIATSLMADMRTKSIRLVPTVDYELSARSVKVVVESRIRDEKVSRLLENLEETLALALRELGYTVDDRAPFEFRMTVDYVDFGSQVKRLVAGSLLGGKGHIEGDVTLTEGGQAVGVFNYSSRLRGGITMGSLKSMAKEVGPPLVLKLDRGERDAELHERPENKKPGLGG